MLLVVSSFVGFVYFVCFVSVADRRVITKQDRLCHVIHATSDPFYMQWLRQMNVGNNPFLNRSLSRHKPASFLLLSFPFCPLPSPFAALISYMHISWHSGHHSKLLTIGDCTKAEIKEYYTDRLISDVPEQLRAGLDFDEIYEFFGGKLAHWSDYLTEYANVDGDLTRISPYLFLFPDSLPLLLSIRSFDFLCGIF